MIVDNSNISCDSVPYWAPTMFLINTETVFQGINPIQLVALLQNKDTCDDLRLVYELYDSNCKKYKKCQLTMSDNANKECKFQCNCKVDDCNDAVYSVGDKGLSVCEIYPIP